MVRDAQEDRRGGPIGPTARGAGEAGAAEDAGRTQGGGAQGTDGFDEFVGNSRDGIIVIDERGRVIVWNAAEERLTGIAASEAMGGLLWDLQLRIAPSERRGPEFLAAARMKIQRGLAEGPTLDRDLEDEIELPDGVRRTIHSRLFSIRRRGRNLACGICRDVTASKEIEAAGRTLAATLTREIAEQSRELDRRARLLRDLASDRDRARTEERARISALLHDELQQQLIAARFHLERLRQAQGELERADAAMRMEEILREAMSTTRTLSHDLARAPSRAGADLSESLRELAIRMEADHGLAVRVVFGGSPRTDGGVQAGALRPRDPAGGELLLMAARELLLNVVKHAGTAEASLRARRHNGCLCLSVSDGGVGFEAGHGGSPWAGGLRTLGESLQATGGRMRICSHPGEGVTVRIVLPDQAGAHPD